MALPGSRGDCGWLSERGGYTGESVLSLGEQLGDLSPVFEKCGKVGVVSHPYAMPRQRFPIYWCRDMRGSFGELWPERVAPSLMAVGYLSVNLPEAQPLIFGQ